MDRSLFTSIICGLSLFVLGCGGRDYNGDQRFPISGTVTVDGELMEYGTISFIPANEAMRVTGGPIVDGKFEVPEARGANAGDYRVEIRWQKGTGKMVKDFDTEEMIEEREEGLPPRYHDDSELTAEVSPENHTFMFDLLSSDDAE